MLETKTVTNGPIAVPPQRVCHNTMPWLISFSLGLDSMATPEPITLNDYQSIVADYHSESDRAAIVLAGSFVEHYLANYLKHFMVQDESTKPLFSGFGPFSTFDQRISTAYAFKL